MFPLKIRLFGFWGPAPGGGSSLLVAVLGLSWGCFLRWGLFWAILRARLSSIYDVGNCHLGLV